jgi:hypothetical protein
MAIAVLSIFLFGLFAFSSCNGNLLFSLGDDTTEDDTATALEILERSLWVVGGLSGNGIDTVVSQIDVFDPVTATWTAGITSLPIPVSFFGAVGYQGKLYIIGGYNVLGEAQAAVQIYDIGSNSWSTGDPLPAARANIDASLIDGYVYILSGSNTLSGAAYNSNSTTYRYNIVSDSWLVRTAPGTNRINFNQVVHGGSLYSLGMRSSATAVVTTHDAYIPVVTGTDVISTTPTVLTLAKAGMVADVYTKPSGTAFLIIIGGHTALVGGLNTNYVFSARTTYTALNTVQFIRSPFLGTVVDGSGWNTAAQSLPDVNGYAGGCITNETFYVMGGTKTGTVASPPSGMTSVYYSDLRTFPSNTWAAGPAMPRGRYGHRVVKVSAN